MSRFSKQVTKGLFQNPLPKNWATSSTCCFRSNALGQLKNTFPQTPKLIFKHEPQSTSIRTAVLARYGTNLRGNRSNRPWQQWGVLKGNQSMGAYKYTYKPPTHQRFHSWHRYLHQMDFLICSGERLEFSHDISWYTISSWQPASPFPSMSKSSVISISYNGGNVFVHWNGRHGHCRPRHGCPDWPPHLKD